MIPSYFKIEILAIQDEFVLLGRKGLTYLRTMYCLVECGQGHLSDIKETSIGLARSSEFGEEFIRDGGPSLGRGNIENENEKCLFSNTQEFLHNIFIKSLE